MLKYFVIVLALMEAGWMAFDGSRALVTGNYTTPKQGPGPDNWACGLSQSPLSVLIRDQPQ